MKDHRTYNAHETERMQSLQGLTLASFTSRASAFVIDFLLAFAMFLGPLVLADRVIGAMGIEAANLNLKFDFEHWYSIIFLVLYFSVTTYLGNGKTPGKWMLGIRVVSLAHERLSPWHSFERALGYGASFAEFGFGFIQYFIDANRRTLHDRIGETIVISERKQ